MKMYVSRIVDCDHVLLIVEQLFNKLIGANVLDNDLYKKNGFKEVLRKELDNSWLCTDLAQEIIFRNSKGRLAARLFFATASSEVAGCGDQSTTSIRYLLLRQWKH